MVATFVAYLSTLTDPKEGEQEGERPTGLFVFANAISGLSVPFAATLSSLLGWKLSGTIKSGILYVYLEKLSKEWLIIPALIFLVFSSICLCVYGARAIRNRSETSSLIRFFSFLLLFANATLLSDPENVMAFKPEGTGSLQGFLLMLIVLIFFSMALTILSSFASAIPDVRILMRRQGFKAITFVAKIVITLVACIGLFIVVVFLVEKLGILGAEYPSLESTGSRQDFFFFDMPFMLKTLSIAALIAIYGTYIVIWARLQWIVFVAFMTRLFGTRFKSVIEFLCIIGVPAVIVFVSYLPFATNNATIPMIPMLSPPLSEARGPESLPTFDWQDFDIVCNGAVGWKYESTRDVAFPLDECRLSVTNGDISSAHVVLGIAFSSMGTTKRKEQERAYRRAQKIARWVDRQLPASIQHREIVVLDLGMRKYRYGYAGRAEQDDHMERPVIVKGAFADFDGTIPFSHSAKSVRSIVDAAFYSGDFSDCTFYVVGTRQTLLPLKNLNCDAVRVAAE